MLKDLSPAVRASLLANLAFTNQDYYDAVGSKQDSSDSDVSGDGYGQYWGVYGSVQGDGFPVRDIGPTLPGTTPNNPDISD